MATLDQAKPRQRLRVEGLKGSPELVQRLLEFGIFEGEVIEVIGFAPLGDPMEIQVGNSRLSLRRREAAGITVSIAE